MPAQKKVSIKARNKSLPIYTFTREETRAFLMAKRDLMAQLPTEPGAYMSSKDRSIFLLEYHGVVGMAWRAPGGTLLRPGNPIAQAVFAGHLPLRQMVPRRRRD